MQYLLFSWDVWVSTITSKVFAFVTNIWLSLQHPQSLTNTSDIYWLLPIFKAKTMPRTTHPSAAETCETLCFIFSPSVLNNPLVPYVSKFEFLYTSQIWGDQANVTSADKGTAASRYWAWALLGKKNGEFCKLISVCLEFGAVYSIPGMNGDFSLSHPPILQCCRSEWACGSGLTWLLLRGTQRV